MERRYLRNMQMLSEAEMEILKGSKVCVVGCGGLGGYVVEMLGRLGVGSITAIDGDTFDETNMNRQLLSDVSVIGKSKAEAAKCRMELVNPLVKVTPVAQLLTVENSEDLLKGHHLIMDAVDSIDTRLLLQESASLLGIPMAHGAIAGWYGQVTTLLPGDRTFDILYANKTSKGIEQQLGNPSFTPALVASIEVSEALKLLIGRGELLRRKVLYIDLLTHEYEIINF